MAEHRLSKAVLGRRQSIQGATAGLALFLLLTVGARAGLGALGVRQDAPADMHYALEASWDLPPTSFMPWDVAVGPGGRQYVADVAHRSIRIYDTEGDLIDEWRAAAEATAPDGHVFVPLAVDIDIEREYGYVLWLDRGSSLQIRLERRALDGLVLDVREVYLSRYGDVVVEAQSGDIVVFAGHAFIRFSREGLVPSTPMGIGFDRDKQVRVAAFADGRLAVTDPASGKVGIYSHDGEHLHTIDAGPDVIAAIDVGPDGLLNTLLIPATATAEQALIATYTADGRRVSDRRQADLGAPFPPNHSWGWAIDVTENQFAFTTGSTVFEIHRFNTDSSAHSVLLGAPLQASFNPSFPLLDLPGPGLAIDANEAGELAVLVRHDGRLLRYDTGGNPSVVSVVARDGKDVAVGSDTVFISTADDRLLGYQFENQAALVWEQTCDCRPGGRLSAGDGMLFVSRPARFEAAAFSVAAGTQERTYTLPDSFGLWPTDVAASTSGKLYTADLAANQIQSWLAPDGPESLWGAGGRKGPRRVASGWLEPDMEVVAVLAADGLVEVFEVSGGRLLAQWRPLLTDGSSPTITDIAVGAGGKVYLVDTASSAIHIFAPSGEVPPTPTDGPSPTPTALGPCSVIGDKVAAPQQVVLGDTASVSLTLAADCPPRVGAVGADVVLLLDVSGSMKGKLSIEKEAIRNFLELLNVRYHRAALVTFRKEASLVQPLTTDTRSIITSLDQIVIVDDDPDGTNLTAAVRLARSHLLAGGREEALPVMILMSDGRAQPSKADGCEAAALARADGIQIFTIGILVVDAETLRGIAGRPDRYYDSPSADDLIPIYEDILQVVLSSLAGNLIIEDRMAPGIEYMVGSAQPNALEQPNRLLWSRTLLPSSGITLTYDIYLRQVGRLPTNERAVASYTDGEGARREFVFPIPEIEVVAPTMTPTPTATTTPTATPTATPTRVPQPAYLPLLLREECTPGQKRVDVALIIDASTSMLGRATDDLTKLQAAQEAASGFLDELRLDAGDQAAIIAFNSTAWPQQRLTADRSALERALTSIEPAPQTCLVCAVAVAADELASERHNTDNQAVMILLTDGKSNPRPASEAVERATEAKKADITIFTIGLGEELDFEALHEIASKPTYFYLAPGAEDLKGIYAQIAVTIPCPAEEFWGQRP